MMNDHQAAIPNPKLDSLKFLVGSWNTTGTHPLVPGITFHGRTTFEWIFGGAFLCMRSQINEKEIPDGIAIFGTDDDSGQLFMLYFDERKVSRKYNAEVKGEQLRWWRNADDLSQRNTMTLIDNGDEIISAGEMSRDHKNWEQDLSLTYNRIL
jgi:hypothetical protein